MKLVWFRGGWWGHTQYISILKCLILLFHTILKFPPPYLYSRSGGSIDVGAQRGGIIVVVNLMQGQGVGGYQVPPESIHKSKSHRCEKQH